MSDRAASMFVNHPHDLGDCALCGLTHHRSQLLFARDDIAEAVPKAAHVASHDTTQGKLRLVQQAVRHRAPAIALMKHFPAAVAA